MTFDTIRINFERGLWSASLVQMAVRKGLISQTEADAIIDGAQAPNEADEILDIIEGKAESVNGNN